MMGLLIPINSVLRNVPIGYPTSRNISRLPGIMFLLLLAMYYCHNVVCDHFYTLMSMDNDG